MFRQAESTTQKRPQEALTLIVFGVHAAPVPAQDMSLSRIRQVPMKQSASVKACDQALHCQIVVAVAWECLQSLEAHDLRR